MFVWDVHMCIYTYRHGRLYSFIHIHTYIHLPTKKQRPNGTAHRATKWLAMLRGWGQFASQKRKRRVRKGIPDAVRRQVRG